MAQAKNELVIWITIFWKVIDYSFQSRNTLYIICYYQWPFLLPICQINGKFHQAEKLLTGVYVTIVLDSITNYRKESPWVWGWGQVLKQKNVLTIVLQGGIYIPYLLHVAIDYLKDILSNTVLGSHLSSYCFQTSSVSTSKISSRKIDESKAECWILHCFNGFPDACWLMYFFILDSKI